MTTCFMEFLLVRAILLLLTYSLCKMQGLIVLRAGRPRKTVEETGAME